MLLVAVAQRVPLQYTSIGLRKICLQMCCRCAGPKSAPAPAMAAAAPAPPKAAARAPAVEAAAKSAGTTVSELRGTTVPFNSLQSAVSRNMLESLKVGEWQWRKSCEIIAKMSVWVVSPGDTCGQERTTLLSWYQMHLPFFQGAY